MKTKGISAEQRNTLLARLSTRSSTGEGRQFTVEFERSRDTEAAALVEQLVNVFEEAGWRVRPSRVLPHGGTRQATIYVRYNEEFCSPPAAAQIVLDAFDSAGLRAAQRSQGTNPNCDVCIGVDGW